MESGENIEINCENWTFICGVKINQLLFLTDDWMNKFIYYILH